MDRRADLLDALRRQLREGATPSALLRSIRAELGDDVSYRDLCNLMGDAFHLGIARLSTSSAGPAPDDRGEFLNRTLLMEILQHRNEWDNGAGRPSWMDSLVVHDPSEVWREVAARPYPGLSAESWAALRPEEQAALRTQLASGQVLSERVTALARLAERLQEKLIERGVPVGS